MLILVTNLRPNPIFTTHFVLHLRLVVRVASWAVATAIGPEADARKVLTVSTLATTDATDGAVVRQAAIELQARSAADVASTTADKARVRIALEGGLTNRQRYLSFNHNLCRHGGARDIGGSAGTVAAM
ncbi:unnamed protein product [Urochloa humidicola]